MSKAQRSAAWSRGNRAIRAEVKAGGLTDDERRALMHRVVGKGSLADCTEREMAAILAALKGSAAEARRGWRRSSKAYIRKIYALWAAAGRSGAVAQADRNALLAFVQRMARSERREGIADLRQLEWLTYSEAEAIIEALKAMVTRAGERP